MDFTPKPEDIVRFQKQAQEEAQALIRLESCFLYAKDNGIVPHEELKNGGLYTHLAQHGEDGVKLSVTNEAGLPLLVAHLRVTPEEDFVWSGYSSATDGSKTASSREFFGALSVADTLSDTLYFQILNAVLPI